MALPNNLVCEIRPSVGSDNNGGGFVAGGTGTDYSQQNSAQFSGTDLASTNATTNPPAVTSAGHTFVSTDVDNTINISAGTNWTAGIYRIVSVSAGAATLDRACGSVASVSSGTWAVGGAWATLSKYINNLQRGMIGWCKASATISQGSQITFFDQNSPTSIIGYTTTRGDGGQVTIQASAAINNNLVTIGRSWIFQNFIIDCNNKGPGSGTAGLAVGQSAVAINVQVKNENWDSGYGFNLYGNFATAINCYVTGCTGHGTSSAQYAFVSNAPGTACYNCVAAGNNTSMSGFASQSQGSLACFGCVAANNTGSNADGYYVDANNCSITLNGCMAYTNGRDGLRWWIVTGGASSVNVINSIFYGNGGYGIDQVANSGFTLQDGGAYLDYNAFGSNTSGDRNKAGAGAHDVTLTGDPTTAGGSNNFALNNTSGAGAACRTAGFPGALQVGGTGYLDIGPLQHQDSGGGGTTTYVLSPNVTRYVIMEGEI